MGCAMASAVNQLTSPDDRDFWFFVHKTGFEVSGWPAWKRGGGGEVVDLVKEARDYLKELNNLRREAMRQLRCDKGVERRKIFREIEKYDKEVSRIKRFLLRQKAGAR